MYYYVKVRAVSNGIARTSASGYFNSNIKSAALIKIKEELKEEALNRGKELLEEKEGYDSIIIECLMPAYLHLQSETYLSEYEESILKIAKKEYILYTASEEGQREFLVCSTMPQVISDINNIRRDSERLGLLDSQEYLNFLDTINKLSIDQDRQDTIKGKE